MSILRRTTTATALLLACVAVMTACGSSTTDAASSSLSTTDKNELFLEQTRGRFPNQATPDADRVEFGRTTVCGSFEQGLTFERLITSIVRGGFEQADAAYIIGSAVSFFCPEQRTALRTS